MPDIFGRLTPEEEEARRRQAATAQSIRGNQRFSTQMPGGMQAGALSQEEFAKQQARNQDFTEDEAQMKSMRQQAAQLRGKGDAKGKRVGPYDVYVGPNWGEVVGRGMEQLGAGLLDRETNKKAEDVKEARLEQATAAEDYVEETLATEKAEEKLATEIAGREAGEFTDGKTVVRGYYSEGKAFDEKGEPLDESFTEVYRSPRSSGSRYTSYFKDDEYGNTMLYTFDKTDGAMSEPTFLDGDPYTKEGSEQRAGVTTEVESERAGEVTGEQEQRKSNQKAIESLDAEISSGRKRLGLYNQALNALEDGARSGIIEGRLPSIREASVKLENAQQELGIEKISDATFGALSEAEGRWVRESAIPMNMDEKYLPDFLMRKGQAANQVLKAAEFEQSYRRKFGKAPDQKLIQGVLYGPNGEYKQYFSIDEQWLKPEE